MPAQVEIPHCKVHVLGRIPYTEAWKLQREIAAQIAQGVQPATLLLLEHPHTYTFGRRGDIKNLLWDQETLKNRGIEIQWVDRGGDVTYHGPGQLIGYPLLQLKSLAQAGSFPQVNYVEYLRRLEQMLIHSVAQLGVAAGQIPDQTGVWVQPDLASRCPNCPPEARIIPSKLASIGVKVDAQGISQHGFALNVNPDRQYWEGIVACGDAEHPAIALVDLLDPPPSMEQVISSIIGAFGNVFNFHMQVTPTDRSGRSEPP